MNRKAALITLTVLLLGVGGYFAYKAVQSPEYRGNPEQRIPGVDYSAGTDEDNAEINKKKESGELDKPQATQADSAINITFIASAQDAPRDDLQVKALLRNATEGNCTLTLEKGSQKVTRSASIVQQNNYYTCDGFSVPYGQLNDGEWKATLKVVTKEGKTNEATTTVNIK